MCKISIIHFKQVKMKIHLVWWLQYKHINNIAPLASGPIPIANIV